MPTDEDIRHAGVLAFRKLAVFENRDNNYVRTCLIGQIIGIRTSLCFVNGWAPEDEAHSAGKAIDLITRYWEDLYPEDWDNTTDDCAAAVRLHAELWELLILSPQHANCSKLAERIGAPSATVCRAFQVPHRTSWERLKQYVKELNGDEKHVHRLWREARASVM